MPDAPIAVCGEAYLAGDFNLIDECRTFPSLDIPHPGHFPLTQTINLILTLTLTRMQTQLTLTLFVPLYRTVMYLYFAVNFVRYFKFCDF